MKDTNAVRSVNKETSAITEVTTSSELELQNKTIEEKRLKLALDLRKF